MLIGTTQKKNTKKKKQVLPRVSPRLGMIQSAMRMHKPLKMFIAANPDELPGRRLDHGKFEALAEILAVLDISGKV